MLAARPCLDEGLQRLAVRGSSQAKIIDGLAGSECLAEGSHALGAEWIATDRCLGQGAVLLEHLDDCTEAFVSDTVAVKVQVRDSLVGLEGLVDRLRAFVPDFIVGKIKGRESLVGLEGFGEHCRLVIAKLTLES